MSRAVALMPPDDPARIDLIPNVRVVQGLTGDLNWAEGVLAETGAAAAARSQASVANLTWNSGATNGLNGSNIMRLLRVRRWTGPSRRRICRSRP